MVNPQFIDIHHFTEAKPDNKAEQISRDEFAAKYHEYTDKKTLKDIRPCAQGKSWQYQIKGIGNA